jgi:uncharacterized membrane protein
MEPTLNRTQKASIWFVAKVISAFVAVMFLAVFVMYYFDIELFNSDVPITLVFIFILISVIISGVTAYLVSAGLRRSMKQSSPVYAELKR